MNSGPVLKFERLFYIDGMKIFWIELVDNEGSLNRSEAIFNASSPECRVDGVEGIRGAVDGEPNRHSAFKRMQKVVWKEDSTQEKIVKDAIGQDLVVLLLGR